MKNLVFITLIASLFFVSCKNDGKKTEIKSTTQTCTYQYSSIHTQVGWTAFKTTDKIGVPGKFKSFKVTTPENATTPEALLTGLQFEIDPASTSTNDAIRDPKIIKNFFGTLLKDVKITGKIVEVKGKKAIVSLSMNNHTHDVVLDYNLDGETVLLKGSLDVAEWDGTKAIAALNKVCDLLHKGADGKSKLWSTVDLNISSKLKKNCK